MIIKNRSELITTDLRRRVLDIIEAGIIRVLPPTIMRSAVGYNSDSRTLSLCDYTYPLSKGRVFVIGGGKATALMAKTLEDILTPDNITAGIVTCNCKSSDYKTSRIKIVEAGHPVPDQKGIEGVKEMLALRERYSIGENDLVISLISGGGSALMPCPVQGVSLNDKQRITELLLSCGAEICEINTVRKNLSKVKGGRLGLFFSPTTVVSLILSDVVRNDLDVIASGPTYPDTSTFFDAYYVLKKYDLLRRASKQILDFLRKGCRGDVECTPKVLSNCINFIIGDNMLALEAMAQMAKKMKLSPYIITAEQKGETTTIAWLRAKEILNSKYAGHDIILIGGETTPKLPPMPGIGGRNQHYAAVSLLAMKECKPEWVVASVGTDGSDFLPGIAGAIVDSSSLAKAQACDIDIESYLDRYDSNRLLRKIAGCLIITGNIPTNVGDVIVYALRP